MNTDELVKQKVDADIARYKSRKPNMTQEQENMLRKEFTRIQIDLIADRKKSEKSKPSLNKIANMLNNKQKTDEKQQKTDEKQQKSNEILSKNSTQYSRAGENDKKEIEKKFYSISRWKTMSQELRKEHPECQLCGKRKSEEVHHIFPFMHQFEDIREEVFLDKDNLICLCSDCHHQVHAKNYGTLGIPERTKIENLRSQISRKYLNQGKILSWL